MSTSSPRSAVLGPEQRAERRPGRVRRALATTTAAALLAVGGFVALGAHVTGDAVACCSAGTSTSSGTGSTGKTDMQVSRGSSWAAGPIQPMGSSWA